MELLKGLEVGEYEFSKYIPEYLGQLALWLPPEQLEEVLTYLAGPDGPMPTIGWFLWLWTQWEC